MTDDLVQRFRRARRDPSVAVLEGFHALKHGLRFGAELLDVVATDLDELDALVRSLALDLDGAVRPLATAIEPDVLAALGPRAPRTGVMALARRPAVDVAAVLADPAPAPIVLLEDPRNLGNLGACVRVAAAAGAAAVLSTGETDPWHPDAVRGAAGLQFALPVARVEEPALERLAGGGRTLVAVDPEGEERGGERLPARAILAFGTERHGLSDALLARAERRVRIPMRPGVSSLNLATSVAALLYSSR